jgi:dTDP-D-glucose 4,6-dehydratase
LDASKAEAKLEWSNKLSFDESLAWTVDWQNQVARLGKSARDVTMAQISEFKKR